jgi:phosphate:Na+ symporter
VAQSLGRAAKALADLRAAHRSATLEMVASGKLTTAQALARVDAVALMSRLTHHAWRAVAHLNRAAAPRLEPPQ